MADAYTSEARMEWMDRAGGGLWWLVAAGGIGLFVLADIIAFFDRTTHTAAAVFALLGFLALEVGLTLSALLGVRWPWGARVALMIAAALIAIRAVGLGGVGALL